MSLFEIIQGGCVLLILVAGIYFARRKALAHCSACKHSTRRLRSISVRETRIIRCRISHHRLFPTKHSFVYPYLSVGIPVRIPESNWLLSADENRWCKKAWLNVSAKDHLHRGKGEETLSEKVDAYLKLQGLDPAEFPQVYLLTSPRFLNYVFNPASFWYLYGANDELRYVIAEVNNTFDERRMYLFPSPQGLDRFRQTSGKDFHVSPFSSRKGSYILSTTNPANDENVSVKVTLCSSKGHPKLVARLWSDAPSIDPVNFPMHRSIWLLISWGPILLTTFAKIVYQAILLARFRNMKIWYRPEPRESAMARRPTAAESFLATVFTRYLFHLVSMASKDYHLSMNSIGTAEETLFPQRYNFSSLYRMGENGHMQLSLRIHTPQFHRQLITYERLSDFLSYTLLHPFEENRTAWSNDAKSLVDVIKVLELTMHKQRPRRRWSLNEAPIDAIWAVYRRSSCGRPFRGTYPDPGLPTRRGKTKRRGDARSQLRRTGTCLLDEFVRHDCDLVLQAQYMAATVGLRWRTWMMKAIGGE